MHAKLWDRDRLHSLLQEIKASKLIDGMFKPQLEAICDYAEGDGQKTLTLQNYVRTQFLCIPKTSWSPALQSWICAMIIPCMEVQVLKWNPELATNAQTLAEKLRSNQLSSISDVNLKIAAHVASGTLNGHPTLQGILVAAIEQAGRLSRGVESMRGLRLSEIELSMMAEAGVCQWRPTTWP